MFVFVCRGLRFISSEELNWWICLPSHDEALAVIGDTGDLTSAEIAKCADRLMKDNPDIMLIVTSGRGLLYPA